MKKRIFSFLLAVFCLFTAGVFVAGCKNGYDPDQYKRVKIIMPEKVHVEYAGVIYVQDGNEVYAKAATVHSSDRLEVYAKLDLTNEVIFDQPQYSQGYITARLLDYGGSNFEWQCAENDTNYSSWHANDYNHGVYAKAESYLRTGYSDINMPYDLEGVTITQLANENVAVGTNQVECIVWEYVWDRNDIYNKEKFWFAADTHIFIKQTEIFDRNDDIDADENIELVATYYRVGETMDTALANLANPRTKYVFDAKYV